MEQPVISSRQVVCSLLRYMSAGPVFVSKIQTLNLFKLWISIYRKPEGLYHEARNGETPLKHEFPIVFFFTIKEL